MRYAVIPLEMNELHVILERQTHRFDLLGNAIQFARILGGLKVYDTKDMKVVWRPNVSA